jgi:uncharacterized protein involved in exopolysaccharide biosynthesis
MLFDNFYALLSPTGTATLLVMVLGLTAAVAAASLRHDASRRARRVAH